MTNQEIYEGDIVKLTKGWDSNIEGIDKEEKIVGEIKYFEPYASFCINGVTFDRLSILPIEVIGNIYENSKLLTP